MKLNKVVSLSIVLSVGLTVVEYSPLNSLVKVEASSIKYEYIVTANSLNVRSKSSTSGKVLGSVKKNAKLTIKKELSNGWLEITYKGKKGYVSGKYVQKKKVTAPPSSNMGKPSTNKPITSTKYEYVVTASSLNVRSKSSTSGKVLGSVKKNTKLTVKKELSNGWLEITYKGKTAYTSGKYVQKKKVNISKPPVTPPKPPVTPPKPSVTPPKPSVTPPKPPVTDTQQETYQTVDLRKLSNVTAKEIDAYIEANVNGAKSKLSGKGAAIIQSARKHGINELVLAGILIHESGFGKSYLSYFKNNISGMKAFDSAPYDSAIRFAFIEQAIDYTAQYIYYNYLLEKGPNYNGPFLGARDLKDDKGNIIPGSGMNVKYSSDPKWGEKIAAHMEKIKKYDNEYYKKQAISKSPVTSSPSYPVGGDTYSSFAKAEALTEFGLYTSKGSGYVRKMKKGEQFIPLEKTNDFCLKVQVDGKVYWTSNLAFSQYKTIFDFKNVLRIYNATGDLGSVSIYANPNTDSKVGEVANFGYLEGVLVKDKMEIVNDFYAIQLNGNKVWIAKDKVQEVY